MTPGTLLWTPAYRPPEALPQTALQALFTITGGYARIWWIMARVTTGLGASASALKFVFDPTSGAADVDLCTAAAMSGLAAGKWMYTNASISPGTALQASDGGGSAQSTTNFAAVSVGLDCPPGSISLNTTGNQTGQAEYFLAWAPITPGALVIVP